MGLRDHASGTDFDPASLTGDYTVDAVHSSIGFAVRHAMISTVRGRFTDFQGDLHLDGQDPTRSHATVDVQVASIETDNADRDRHLKSADFFTIEDHPVMAFRSTSVESLDGPRFRMTGELALLDTVREITLDVEFTGASTDPMGNRRAGFEARGELLRSEWGLNFNIPMDSGGVVISDRVRLELDISAIQKH